MKTQTSLIALQFLLPLCSILNMTAADQPEKQTVVYKKAGSLEIKADVYHFADTQARPAVVSLHGGAFIMGHRENLSNAVKDFACTNGYVLFSFDYRLAPERKLPAIIDDRFISRILVTSARPLSKQNCERAAKKRDLHYGIDDLCDTG